MERNYTIILPANINKDLNLISAKNCVSKNQLVNGWIDEYLCKYEEVGM